MASSSVMAQPVTVVVRNEDIRLPGELLVPPGARALVIFAHGSGSGRHSPRNRSVAQSLAASGLATLLFDLLTADEERLDQRTAEMRFDITLLAGRVLTAVDWAGTDPRIGTLRTGLFGASTGAAAALVAASERRARVHAVVSRGGRPDLAGPALARVAAPTLLIVGSRDEEVIRLNRDAMAQLRARTQLVLVDGATHLFEEPGALDKVSELARDWFLEHLLMNHL
jgi:putative phosphoribosyl transferase